MNSMGFFKKIKRFGKKENDLTNHDNVDEQHNIFKSEPELESTPKPTPEFKSQTGEENPKESIHELDPSELKKRKERIEKTRENMSSYFEPKIPSPEEILHSEGNPYIIFGISNKAACHEIKSQYKELSIKYNAARGIHNKTPEEIEKITKVQMMVNQANEELKKNHNCE